MEKLKNVLILVLAAFLSPLMISCSDSSIGGGNSDIPAADNTVQEKEGVDKINFPSEPFSLLGVYTVKTYAINGNVRAAADSELRVNVDITDASAPVIQMRLSLNGIDNEFTKALSLTEEDFKDLFGFIAKTFADLGAEVSETDPYGLKFTMTGKQYPELVSSGIIGENDILVLNLDKIRNLGVGEGLDYSDEDDTPKDNSVKVTSITITDTPAKVTHGDAGFQLNAEVQPDNADNKKLSWTSSHPKNAEVDSNGYVTIKDYTDQIITITAKSTDGSNKTDKWSFNMQKAEITSISLAKSSSELTLRRDGAEVSENIIPIVTPSYAEPYAAITYNSSDANIASVDANGKVTAKSAGSAIITVYTGSLTTYFTVKVNPVPAVTVAVTGVTVTSVAKTYAKGDTVTVAFTLTPANTTETTVTYSGAASGSVIASNGSGTITLTNIQNSGTLTLTTEKNHKASYNIDARDRVTHISFTDSGWTLDQDSSATHEIDKASDVKKSGTVTYASADTSIATVNASTGQVTGKKNGVTTITATFTPAYTGTPITASYEIDVLGLVDFSSAQAFSDSAQGIYNITFFGTRPGNGTGGSGFLCGTVRGQTNVPVTNSCTIFETLFGSGTCVGTTFASKIEVDDSKLAGRMVIEVDNSGSAKISTKLVMTADGMVKNSNDDQYQYTIYRPTSAGEPYNTNYTVKDIKGRNLSNNGDYPNSTFKVEKYNNVNKSKTIQIYSQMMNKVISVTGCSNVSLNPETYIVATKISSKTETMDYDDITVEPFNKVKPLNKNNKEVEPTKLGSTPPSY